MAATPAGIATASTDEKLEKARSLGADESINYSDEPRFHKVVRRLTEGRGVEVVVEHVGAATWESSLASLARNGRLVTCGATTGYDARVDLRHLFFKHLSLLGSFMGRHEELVRLLPFFEDGRLKPVVDRVLNLLLILHADHEQNCSTSTVRMVGSSGANLFASVSAGICALWGPLHGGANQAVIEMLEKIQRDGADYKKYVAMAKDKDSGFRLMGFGHRVYKNFDPRARILKEAADAVLNELGVTDPLLEIAKNLEEVALKDEYFIQRNLYPNVDFYSGIIYRAMGLPTNMFTVLFALGRLPGWIAHWKEMREDKSTRINRPRQIYTGAAERQYVPIDKR